MPYSPIRTVLVPAIVAVLLVTSSCTSTPVRDSIANTPSQSTDSVAKVVKELKAQSAPGGVLESIRAVLVVVRGRTAVEFSNGGSVTTPQ